MVLYSPDWTNIWLSFILLTVNMYSHPTLIEHGQYYNALGVSLASQINKTFSSLSSKRNLVLCKTAIRSGVMSKTDNPPLPQSNV